MIEKLCKKGCCRLKICPLITAFGRTIHSFRGQEAGPGKPIPTIVVNPGDRSFEVLNPGTLNCCVARDTSLGDDGNYNSSIIFTGHQMTISRIQNMITAPNGKIYKKVQLRQKWEEYLQTQKQKTKTIMENYSSFSFKKICNKMQNTKISIHDIDGIIKYHQENNIHSSISDITFCNRL